MAKKIDLSKIADYRRSAGLNQGTFWSKYGITQSAGSRYEAGRNIPKPTSMLIWLRESGVIEDKDLAAAMKAVRKT